MLLTKQRDIRLRFELRDVSNWNARHPANYMNCLVKMSQPHLFPSLYQSIHFFHKRELQNCRTI